MTQSNRYLVTLTNVVVSGRARAALVVGACLLGTVSLAQAGPDPAPATPADGSAASEPAVPPPATDAVAPAPPATESAAVASPPAETAIVAAPPPPAEQPSAPAFPPLSAMVWSRLGVSLQGTKPSKLNDVSENGEIDLIMGGQIHKHFSITGDLVATFGPTGPDSGDIAGSIAVLDLIAKMELHDLFNVWIGRMLVPSDRSNFSGPWFMAPWSYPGFFQAFSPPVGPRQGPFGRNNGVTVWGQVGGGLFKYYAGAFDLFDMAESPLFSGRVNLSLLAPEPGYLHSSAYYGKNILAAGVGAQFKKNGSVSAMPDVMADNFAEINADILYEHPFQNTSVLDVEAAVYAYAGANEAVKSSFYALASYLLPTTVGFGKLQPLVRFQGAVPKDGGDMWRILEAQLGYVVKPYAARLAVVYQRTDVADQTANAIIFGVQLQK